MIKLRHGNYFKRIRFLLEKSTITIKFIISLFSIQTLMKKTLFLLLALLPIVSILAQAPTIQDCLGAIPVCERIYRENFVRSGDGNISQEINPEITCGFPEEGSVWYTFKVNESGDFGFIITPNQLSDDYDWVLYNITNAKCSDIYFNPSLMVSCNAAGSDEIPYTCNGKTGATGATRFNAQTGGCGQFPPRDIGYSPF